MGAMTFVGLKLEVDDVGGNTDVEVTGITSYDNPGSTQAEIDVTDSQSVAKEFILDIPDNGQISFNYNVDHEDAGQDKIRTAKAASAQLRWTLTFSDETTLIWNGYCTSMSGNGSNGDAVRGTIVSRVNGAFSGTSLPS